MRRVIGVMLAMAFLLTGCGATDYKKDVFMLVATHYDVIVTACEQQDAQALLAIDGIQKVNVTDGYILAFCKGAGISTSSQDYGFYYSQDDSPVAVDCNLEIIRYTEDLLPYKGGYQCVVNGNTFYTQRIKDHLYFYCNAY